LAQHVVDAGALEHGAHRATGDDTGTGRGRTEHDDTRGGLADDRVGDGALDAGDAEEVLLRLLDTLRDRGGHLLGLAVADTDGAVAVTDDDQGGEAEATTTLDDLGDAVDGHDPLEELALVTVAAAVAAVSAGVVGALIGAGGTGASPLGSGPQMFLFSTLWACITVPGPLRGHRRPPRRRGRGTGCHHGRRRPRRRPPAWRALRRARRPSGPARSCRPPSPARRPPWSRPRRQSCRRCRRQPGRRRAGSCG